MNNKSLSGLQKMEQLYLSTHEELITAGIAQAEKPASFNIVTVGERSKNSQPEYRAVFRPHV